VNLLWLFFILAISGFVFAKLEPLLVVPVIAPLALFKSTKNPFFYLYATFGWLWQVYLVLTWCVIAVLLTQHFASRPSVDFVWIYYVLGFFGCLAPVQFMLSFDREPDNRGVILQLATLLLTAGGFIAFALAPQLGFPWFWIFGRNFLEN
jgi:hypothetical protein